MSKWPTADDDQTIMSARGDGKRSPESKNNNLNRALQQLMDCGLLWCFYSDGTHSLQSIHCWDTSLQMVWKWAHDYLIWVFGWTIGLSHRAPASQQRNWFVQLCIDHTRRSWGLWSLLSAAEAWCWDIDLSSHDSLWSTHTSLLWLVQGNLRCFQGQSLG